jgi:hypothetical protein
VHKINAWWRGLASHLTDSFEKVNEFSALKMKGTCSSESSINYHETAQCFILEEGTLYTNIALPVQLVSTVSLQWPYQNFSLLRIPFQFSCYTLCTDLFLLTASSSNDRGVVTIPILLSLFPVRVLFALRKISEQARRMQSHNGSLLHGVSHSFQAPSLCKRVTPSS